MRGRTLTIGFPLSETTSIVVRGYPGDDWQALCAFPLLSYVWHYWHLDDYIISDSGPSNDDPFTDEQSTTYNPTLTVPIEAYDTVSLDSRVSRATTCSTERVCTTSVNTTV
jgi:hypothetical protein